jgi:tetraacyldisaccharide 4'-kinase
MHPLSVVYGQVVRFRRHWYERHPHRQQQLGCPVISVGNLVIGGSGKTPIVALVAATLRDAGYRPAILSRGYRRRGTEDVVVVSDGRAVIAAVDRSGDEPQMLARRLPGVPVVVSADRYRAGVLARERLGANALILDDGFQHLRVARTVDLLLVSPADVRERVMPEGHLREPLDAARRADALLVTGQDDGDRTALARELGTRHAFGVRTSFLPLQTVHPFGTPVDRPVRRVLAMAAIARPERFLSALRALGFSVEHEIVFRDHHWFTPADLRRAEAAAEAAGADAIVTTEKDAVRIEPLPPGTVPVVFMPIAVHVEPAEAFRAWLLERVGTPGPHA